MHVRFSKTLRRHLRDDSLYNPRMTWSEELSQAADKILDTIRNIPRDDLSADVQKYTEKHSGLSSSVLEAVWQRFKEWPHTREVEAALGNISMVQQETVPQIISTYSRWQSQGWYVPRLDWVHFQEAALCRAFFQRSLPR